jgi:mannitol/fructose-specific phosphotransferase system IIA component (Ntr-type)
MSAVSAARAPVRLAEIFPPEAILMGLGLSSKSGVIEHLVRHAAALGHVPWTAEDALVRSVLEREGLGTTALGDGIAFPHCKSGFTERFVGVAGFLSPAIPFAAVDAEPVDSVFLILAPRERQERFLDILARLVAVGRDKSLGRLLRGCRTPEHVSSFLQELDQSGLSGPGTARAASRRYEGEPRAAGS